MTRLLNQCPKCNGFSGFFTQDINGETYYKCNRGMTRFMSGSKEPGIYPCDTVIKNGEEYHGSIGWITPEGKLHTITV